MNIIYINGFNGENSNKPKVLSELLNEDIKHLKLRFNNGKINTKELDSYFEDNDIDLVMGSSTGGYIARYYCNKHNIPLISLNPVVDINKTFSKIGYKINLDKKFNNLNELSLSNFTLLNKDDDLIDYRDALKVLGGHFKVYKKGGHRFDNIKYIKDDLEDFIKYLLI